MSEDYILEISHIDIISGLLSAFGASDELKREIFVCLSEKNAKGARDAAIREGISRDRSELISDLISLHGTPKSVLPKLEKFAVSDEVRAAICELCDVLDELARLGLGKNLRIDFSVINNTNYYNGIAFCGFVGGAPSAVLLGGQYDKMMKQMKRRSRAIGFAVYLDELMKLRG